MTRPILRAMAAALGIAAGFRRLIILPAALMGIAVPVVAADAPLSFGVLPYVTPQRLVKTMAPLRDLLAEVTGRPVELRTGPGYRVFHEQTLRGDFDVVLTSAYLGRAAADERQFQMLAQSRYHTYAMLVVRNDSSIRQISELRGKTVAVPDPMSTLYGMVVRYLRYHGLEPDRDVALRIFDTNQNSLSAPLRGDADVGVTGYTLWVTEAPHDRLRVVGVTPRVPGFMMLANPLMPPATAGRIRAALLAFHKTAAGRNYFGMTRQEAWIAVDAASLKLLDDFKPVR